MPPAPAKPPEEIELTGFTLPTNIRLLADGSSSLMRGNSFANSMNVSGLVERITLNQVTGVITIYIRDNARRVFFYPTGLMAEELLP